jgi:hypothetical protein
MLTGPQGAFPFIPVYWVTFATLRKNCVECWEPNPLSLWDLTSFSITEE